MNCRAPSFHFFLGCAMTLLLAGCSSSKKEEEASGATVSNLDRFMNRGIDRKTGYGDTKIRSEFEQKAFSSSSKFKDQQFHADSFAGKHDYTGSSAYKSKEFSQSGKESREGKKTFSHSSKTLEEAGKNYDTKDSRYGSQQARQGDKSFAGGDETYKTGEVRDAAKSQKKNVKPEILPKDDETGKSAYSEADVRRMVNRN